MQQIIKNINVRTPMRTSSTAASTRNAQQVQATVPRRELLATGAAAAAALFGATGAARAAGEASATRAITSVTRPLQLKKKEENRAALKEQVEKVKAGEADPKSLP